LQNQSKESAGPKLQLDAAHVSQFL